MLSHLLHALWPSRCIACSAPLNEIGLCPLCQETLVPAEGVSCTQCGDIFIDLPTPFADFTCGPCLRAPSPFTRFHSAFAYGGAIRDAIVAWKNKPQPELGRLLGGMMVTSMNCDSWTHIPPDTEVIAIPTSFGRAFRRGFNPAGQLARIVAKTRGLHCNTRGLMLSSKLPISRGLSQKQRISRPQQRFSASASVTGKTILLIDDVRTTGRTLKTAARVLLQAGASRIDAAVLAAVPSDGELGQDLSGLM